MRRWLLLVCVASVLVAGCRKRPVHALSTSYWAAFGHAALHSQFVEHVPTGRVVPLVRVLCVPDWDLPPRTGHGSWNSRGTVDRLEIECTFSDNTGEVTMQPIHVLDAERVQAAGRTWDLRAGNVFVALVNRDGSLRVTQLSTNETTPAGVLAFVKRSLPAEPRVQALEGER